MTLRLGDYCGMELARLGDHDRRIWVLDGDLGDSNGATHFAQRHPDRFVMAGIAEQTMVSAAAGIASCGGRPWVFSFAAFLCYRAYDQIRMCLSQANQPVTLVGSHSGGCAGRNGRSHAALNDLSLMTSLPNMTVWAPADPADVRLAIRSILQENRPAYLRLPRRPVDALPGRPARCRWLTDPRPVALLGTGLGTHLAFAAAAELSRRDELVGLLHCPQVLPLPHTQLATLLRDVEHLVSIEDHYSSGGLGSLLQHAKLTPQTTIVGWPMHWTGKSGDDQQLLSAHRLDAESLADRVLDTLANTSSSRPSSQRQTV
ncbi:MAG TPA: transketolase C-terminal domain-containing protein [Mycobacterium sp.]|nr:transketolase C-terminal domain-containing protein [Mycobacterium sp.]